MPDPTLTPERQQQIAANVQKMRSMGASEREVESYLRDHEGLQPVGSRTAATADIPEARPRPTSIGGRLREALAGGNIPRAFWRGVESAVPGVRLLSNVDADQESGAIKAVRSGMTLGIGDEVRARLRSSIDAGAGRGGETYARRVAEERDELDRYREANPVTAFALEAAGGLATLPAAAPVRGAGLLRSGLRLARAGAASGAAYGAGSAEGGAGERLRGAATGATVGAVAAPLLGGAANVVGRGAGWVADVVPGIRPAVSGAGDRLRTSLSARGLLGDQVGAVGDRRIVAAAMRTADGEVIAAPPGGSHADAVARALGVESVADIPPGDAAMWTRFDDLMESSTRGYTTAAGAFLDQPTAARMGTMDSQRIGWGDRDPTNATLSRRLLGNETGAVGDIGGRTGGAGLPLGPEVLGEAAGAIRGRLITSLEDRGLERIARAVERGSVTVDDAIARLEAADPDALLTPMELFGQPGRPGNPIQRLARGVHTTPGKGGTQLGEVLEDRVHGQLPRLRSASERALGQSRDKGLLQTIDEIDQIRGDEADELYGALFAKHGAMDDRDVIRLVNALEEQVPGTRNAAERVINGEVQAGRASRADYFTPEGLPTLRYVDTFKRTLDGRVRLGKRSPLDAGGIDGESEAVVGNLRGLLLNRLDELTDGEYKAVRDAFAGRSEIIEAMDAGTDALSGGRSTEAVRRELGGFSEAGQEGYRRGALEGIMGTAEMKAEGSNLVSQLSRVPGRRERMAALIGDEDEVARWNQTLRDEDDFVGSRNFVRTGSNSIDKAQDVADIGGGPFLEEIASAAAGGNVKQYLLNRLLRSGVVRLSQGRTERLADAIAPNLTLGARGGLDREALMRFLERLREIQARNAQRAGTRNSRTGRVAGEIGGQFAAD